MHTTKKIFYYFSEHIGVSEVLFIIAYYNY